MRLHERPPVNMLVEADQPPRRWRLLFKEFLQRQAIDAGSGCAHTRARTAGRACRGIRERSSGIFMSWRRAENTLGKLRVRLRITISKLDSSRVSGANRNSEIVNGTAFRP